MHGDTICTVPTVGLQYVSFQRRNLRWGVWDMSGLGKYRELWNDYAGRVQAIVFCVDITDMARIAIARDELRSVLANAERRRDQVPLLILANKSDLEGADEKQTMSLVDLRVALGLESIEARHPLHMSSTSAMTGAGIEEALMWLTAQCR
ncbi:unnamed protein product [Chrysoparadoxa australica]